MGTDTALDAVLMDIDSALTDSTATRGTAPVLSLLPDPAPAIVAAPDPAGDLELRQMLEQLLLRTPTPALPATAPADEMVSAAGPAAAVEAPAQARPEQAEPTKAAKTRVKAPPLPDGVLGKAGWKMVTAIGVIAAAAMGEAGWNLATFVHQLLHLPAILAGVFPVIAETTALSFAVQDLSDRRQGVESLPFRVATHVTLVISAAVNGVVGVAMYGLGGLLEVIPPLALGVVIHLHGDRATRAHRTRARLLPAWREQQLRAAALDSAVEVLPLLTGTSSDGQATVGLLRRRLSDGTLEPGDALIAAGWHDRAKRNLIDSQLRRLETVAATVWGQKPPPPPAPSLPGPATPSGAAATTPPVAQPPSPSAPNPTGSTPRKSTGSSTAKAATTPESATRRADDATLATLVAEARAARPNAGEGSVRTLLKRRHLTGSAERIRAALRAADQGSPTSNPDGQNDLSRSPAVFGTDVVGQSGSAEGGDRGDAA